METCKKNENISSQISQILIELTKLRLASEIGKESVKLTCPHCKYDGKTVVTERVNERLKPSCTLEKYVTIFAIICFGIFCYGLIAACANFDRNYNEVPCWDGGRAVWSPAIWGFVAGLAVFVLAMMFAFFQDEKLRTFNDKIHSCGRCGGELGTFSGYDEYVRDKLKGVSRVSFDDPIVHKAGELFKKFRAEFGKPPGSNTGKV